MTTHAIRHSLSTKCITTFCFVIALATLLTNTAPAAQNVVVILDDSGSMQEQMRSTRVRRMDAAKEALITVIKQLPADAQLGVLALNSRSSHGEWIVPLGPIDGTLATEQIRRVNAEGGTPLGMYMKTAADALLKLRSEQHYGEYRLLIVTDGEANDPELLEMFLPRIIGRSLAVDVIGVDMAGEHSLAQKVDSYRRADDPASLQQAIAEVLAETPLDDSAALEEDFALLEGFPDEIAVAAVQALTSFDNNPLGWEQQSPATNGYSANSGSAQPAGSPSNYQQPAAEERRSGKFAITVLVILAVLVLRVFTSAKKLKRRLR